MHRQVWHVPCVCCSVGTRHTAVIQVQWLWRRFKEQLSSFTALNTQR